MRFRMFGVLVVVLVSIPALAGAGSRPGLDTEAGARFDGRFFPYVPYGPYGVEGMALRAEPKEEPRGCCCWRAFGAFTGGAVGFVGYIPIALSDSRMGVSDTQRLVEWSAVTVGAAYLGYWIVKKVDGR